MTTETQTAEVKSEAVKRYKIGRTQATIWVNQIDGGVDHAVSIEQRYRDTAGVWQSSNNYRLAELLGLREITDCAIAELMKLQTPNS
ncbi:hypothetical protein CCAX7_46270 [Capsulimonas corticalis]|uniref:Uncharacterized protein n=1 Tax=Capsulimonas corticalis TaxID=2219043 RepID=A0A402D568_9BACT|nr:hypothetical protein [Capsulimonas corticalis]BDI32576.1 hypothetical protein CCAX7_46270 [Capsulimonas corticalis]